MCITATYLVTDVLVAIEKFVKVLQKCQHHNVINLIFFSFISETSTQPNKRQQQSKVVCIWNLFATTSLYPFKHWCENLAYSFGVLLCDLIPHILSTENWELKKATEDFNISCTHLVYVKQNKIRFYKIVTRSRLFLILIKYLCKVWVTALKCWMWRAVITDFFFISLSSIKP